MNLAPSLTASFSAAARSAMLGLLPSTSRMWHRGHADETASRSSEVSSAQPESSPG